MKVNCSICQTEIDTDSMATVAKVIGWVEYKNGSARGTIKDASSPLGWAHKVCVDTTKDEPSLW